MGALDPKSVSDLKTIAERVNKGTASSDEKAELDRALRFQSGSVRNELQQIRDKGR